MSFTRRGLIGGIAALPVMAQATRAAAQTGGAPIPAAVPSLPDRTNFKRQGIYLDSGSSHPIGQAAKAALDAYVARRAGEPVPPQPRGEEDAKSKFARLINAAPDEIAFCQSTTTAEQMIVRALGLPEKGARIVTDTLHFFGSFPMYGEMAKQGCDVTWVKHREDGSIAIEDMERAIRKGTRLVAVSLVATFNGFRHDLKRLCEIAHAAGAMVYADIIHAAGCIPVDVKESGVDFAACSTYKWLMGDFGFAFLYARKEHQQRLNRVFYGYHGMAKFETHVYPLDTPGATISDYAYEDSANGFFALGTYSHTGETLVGTSLDYIHALGPARIQAHSRPLIAHLRAELTKRGYRIFTPESTDTPFLTCIYEDARGKLGPNLAQAGIRMTVSKNRFRVTTSVFNDMDDIEKLLAVLP